MGIVYKITNTQSEKVYIGSSINKKRFKQHIQLLNAKTHPIKEMQSDYELFGDDVFTCKVLHSLDNISDYDLRRLEEEEIKNHSDFCVLYNTETACGSLYPNIKAEKISHKMIASAFGFANVLCFNNTSAHKRYMNGIENIIDVITNKWRTRELRLLVELERKEKTLKRLISGKVINDGEGHKFLYPDDVFECIEKVYPEITLRK